MTDHKTDASLTFHPSIKTDRLRPALLWTGTQIMIALIGSLLLTSGVGA